MIDFNVAIYGRAEKGKLRHWAIWLRAPLPGESIILQITDNMYGYGYRIADPIYTSPFRTEKLERVIDCGSIQQKNHDRAIDAILNYPVHNREITWNCQSWVMECLDMLIEMGVMDCSAQGRNCLEALRE
ncbi:hypothetical protein N7486_003237 [Penicillium sp. IBT 16267x]|nr:hypothetical protein N7486_003237 [Penicillium sp. IBT 16267x]